VGPRLVLAAAKFIGASGQLHSHFFFGIRLGNELTNTQSRRSYCASGENRETRLYIVAYVRNARRVGFGIELAFTTAALLLLGVEPTTIVMINLISGAVVALWITRKYITLLPNPRRLIMGAFTPPPVKFARLILPQKAGTVCSCRFVDGNNTVPRFLSLYKLRNIIYHCNISRRSRRLVRRSCSSGLVMPVERLKPWRLAVKTARLSGNCH